MATYTWLAPGGGDFNVASNWTLDGVNPAPTAPGPNDIADFNVQPPAQSPVTPMSSGSTSTIPPLIGRSLARAHFLPSTPMAHSHSPAALASTPLAVWVLRPTRTSRPPS